MRRQYIRERHFLEGSPSGTVKGGPLLFQCTERGEDWGRGKRQVLIQDHAWEFGSLTDLRAILQTSKRHLDNYLKLKRDNLEKVCDVCLQPIEGDLYAQNTARLQEDVIRCQAAETQAVEDARAIQVRPSLLSSSLTFLTHFPGHGISCSTLASMQHCCLSIGLQPHHLPLWVAAGNDHT